LADQLHADYAGLQGLVEQLRTGAASIDGPARSMPPAPDAGRSSANVGAAITELGKSAAALAAKTEDAANNIDAAHGSYAGTDNGATDDFRRLGNLHGPR
jgi:hypothetical protein